VLDCIFTVEPRSVTVHNIGAAFDGFLDDDGIRSKIRPTHQKNDTIARAVIAL